MEVWHSMRDIKCPKQSCYGSINSCEWICIEDGGELLVSQTGQMKCHHGDKKRPSHQGPICQWSCTYEKSGQHGYTMKQKPDEEGFLLALSQAIQLTETAGPTWVVSLCRALGDQFSGRRMSGNNQGYSQTNGQRRGIPFPSHWIEMGTTTLKEIPIDNGTAEWKDVARCFTATLQPKQILSIRRIQHKFHWEMFYIKRLKLESLYGTGSENELKLFHGTSPDKVAAIREHNLDPRLCGAAFGTVHGQGTYFSPEAQFSDYYVIPDQSGHKFMFLARVLAGRMCLGNPDYRRPPLQNPDNPLSPLFDCCVDSLQNPNIFCVFHDTQYYLEYLIEYI